MRGQHRPFPGLRFARRAAAAVVSLLMATGPVVSQDATAPAANTSTATEPSSSTTKANAVPKAPRKQTSHASSHSSSHVSSSHTSSSRSSANRAARLARTARLKKAFVASTELRPMAQQLALLRTPEAYAGVAAYAHSHTGEAAAAAYLALGHADLLDKRYADAATNLELAQHNGEELADYADFLGARADHDSGKEAAAETLLHSFTERYPESIFNAQEPELEANVLLAMNNLAAARQVLSAAEGTAAANRPAFQLDIGQVEFALGQKAEAEATFKHVL